MAWGGPSNQLPERSQHAGQASEGCPLCSVVTSFGPLSAQGTGVWGGAHRELRGSTAPGAAGPGSSHPVLGLGGTGDKHSVSERQAVGQGPAFEGQLGSSRGGDVWVGTAVKPAGRD